MRVHPIAMLVIASLAAVSSRMREEFLLIHGRWFDSRVAWDLLVLVEFCVLRAIGRSASMPPFGHTLGTQSQIKLELKMESRRCIIYMSSSISGEPYFSQEEALYSSMRLIV